MKGWFNKTSNIKLRLSVFLIVYLLHFLHKKTNTPDHYEVKRTCCRYEVFTFDYINIYEDIQTLITQLTINYYSVSMLEYKNLNSFFQLLLLLSGDINLNQGPVHQDATKCSSEWNVFRNRGLHFIHFNINSLLLKIEEFRSIAKSNNAAVIGICKSKLDASVLEQEICLSNYKILRCDRNRHGRGVACYVRQQR